MAGGTWPGEAGNLNCPSLATGSAAAAPAWPVERWPCAMAGWRAPARGGRLGAAGPGPGPGARPWPWPPRLAAPAAAALQQSDTQHHDASVHWHAEHDSDRTPAVTAAVFTTVAAPSRGALRLGPATGQARSESRY